MTFRDALTQRVDRIRLPEWKNPETCLILPLLPNGQHGPWVKLYDPWCGPDTDIFIGTLMNDAEARYEPASDVSAIRPPETR